MDYKICTKCHFDKKTHDFNWKDKEKTRRHTTCKACHSNYRKRHYQENRQKYIDKAKKWNNTQKKKIYQFLIDYLSTHPCVDCKEADIVVFDFDHSKDKFLSISEMTRNSYSIHAIQQEIKKCEVRCANCHRRRTSKDRGYWKHSIITQN
jgi:hypothetical protein